MAKYRGYEYEKKPRTATPMEPDALANPGRTGNEVLDRTVREIVYRLNRLSPLLKLLNARNADDMIFTDEDGNRTSVGNYLDEMNDRLEFLEETPTETDAVLLEDGSSLFLEDGTNLQLETAS